MARVNQTRPHCVSQMGKTQFKPLVEWHSLFGPCCWSEHRPFRVTSGSSAWHFDSRFPRLLGQHVSCCYVSAERIWRRDWEVLLVAFEKLRKATLPSSCLSVRPPVRMEQLGSHCSDFHEIWYLNIFRKPVYKIQVSLKSDKNNGYFTWRPIWVFDYISLSSS
jgi:hypothetical protein